MAAHPKRHMAGSRNSPMDLRNAFIALVESPADETAALPEGDHQWLSAELAAYLARDISPIAVAIALLAYDFARVEDLWAALAAQPSFQELLATPIDAQDSVTRAASALMAMNAEHLDDLSDGRLWPFFSACRVAYYRELLDAAPGAAARLLLARHLVSHPDLVGAGWGDGPTAVNAYLVASDNHTLAAALLTLGDVLPESVAREIQRLWPELG